MLSILLLLLVANVCVAQATNLGEEQQDTSVQQFVFEVDDTEEEQDYTEEIIAPMYEIYEEQEDIVMDSGFFHQYKVNQTKEFETFKDTLEKKPAEDLKIGNDVFNISTRSVQYNSSTTTAKKFYQEIGATFKHQAFSLTSGMDAIYDVGSNVATVSGASTGAFITPKLQLGNRAAISLKNKFSGQKMEYYEPYLGLNYSPKFLKNSDFFIGAGATFKDNVLQSQSFKFVTNFYLF